MPFASVLVVVVLVVLLDRHVGQVDERVIHLAHLAVVLRGAKSNSRNVTKQGIAFPLDILAALHCTK